MNKIINQLISLICYINTGAMLACACFITLFHRDETFPYYIFWQIAFMSLITSIISVLMCSNDNITKEHAKFRNIIHYILINVMMIVSAYIFKWIKNDYIVKTFVLFLLVSAVYAGVTAMCYKNDKKTAEQLNKRLLSYNSQENDKR